MSTDRSVTEDLMEILVDGRDGFAHAADHLEESDRPDLAPTFRGFSAQRAGFYDELERLAAVYGDDVEESGSASAAAHRAWMSVKDALAGSSPEGVLDAAERGEDEAVGAYTDALNADISANLRSTIQKQFTQVKATRDEVKALRKATS